MMGEHTSTPWRVCDSHPQRAAIYIKPEEGWGEIAALYGGFDDDEVKDENGIWQNDTTRMANAAFIVKAVNSHDAMRDCLEWINRKGGMGLDVHDRIRDVLASIKERA